MTASTPDPGHRYVRPARYLLLAVVVTVVTIVFWPAPPAAGAQDGLRAWLEQAHTRGLPTWISFALIEWTSNVVMFLPLGALGSLSVRRRWVPWVIPAAAGLSGLVELVQLIGFPERTATVADIVANTLGATLGLLLVLPVIRRARPAGMIDDRRPAAARTQEDR